MEPMFMEDKSLNYYSMELETDYLEMLLMIHCVLILSQNGSTELRLYPGLHSFDHSFDHSNHHCPSLSLHLECVLNLVNYSVICFTFHASIQTV